MVSVSIEDYLRNFCGPEMQEPIPGEHHFVSLCLIPLILKNIKTLEEAKKLKYINPDGAKAERHPSILLHDITFNSMGLEIKYSKDQKISFTPTQIKSFYNVDGFKGILALRQVKTDKPEVWFIDAEAFRSIQEKLSSKAKKSIPYWIEEKLWTKWEDNYDRKFLDIFGL